MTLRCSDCGIPIKKARPQGRAPKYCADCRKKRQEEFKQKRSK